MDERKVWLTEDFYDLPEGSCIYVHDEGTDEDGTLLLDGTWCSMAGSYFVTVPASICTDVDPDKEMWDNVREWMKTPEGQAHLQKFKEIAGG